MSEFDEGRLMIEAIEKAYASGVKDGRKLQREYDACIAESCAAKDVSEAIREQEIE